jgi:O-antigen/teichoic acid export membrane protein
MHSTELLQLIGLSAPFSVVVVLYYTLAWLEQRVWLLAGFQAAVGATVLTLVLILLPRMGLNAVGWAYLITQMLSAVVAAPYLLRWMRRNRLARVRS